MMELISFGIADSEIPTGSAGRLPNASTLWRQEAVMQAAAKRASFSGDLVINPRALQMDSSRRVGDDLILARYV